MLSEAQKRHFEIFGFLILRQLFSADEIDLIRREYDRLLSANRQGRPFSGTQRQGVIPFFERSPALLELGIGPPEPMPIFED